MIAMIFTISIIAQLFVSLCVYPIFAVRKYGILGYEKTLNDGEDILVFMMCTFCLVFSPITLWFYVPIIRNELRICRILKSIPDIAMYKRTFGWDAEAIVGAYLGNKKLHEFRMVKDETDRIDWLCMNCGREEMECDMQKEFFCKC